jgi:hypothetical protein
MYFDEELSAALDRVSVKGIPLVVAVGDPWWNCALCDRPLTNHAWPCWREMDLREARLKGLA